MKFNKIEITKEQGEKKGIAKVELQRLSNIIAFVGRNGSGKSRILDLLEEHLFNNVDIYKALDGQVLHYPKTLQPLVKEIQPITSYVEQVKRLKKTQEDSRKDPGNQLLRKEIVVLQGQMQRNSIASRINDLAAQFLQQFSSLKKSYFRRIHHKDIQLLKQAIDSSKQKVLPFENLIENVSNIEYSEFSSISKTALSYLSKFGHQFAADKFDCLENNVSFEETISYKRFLSLREFILAFLNKELSWERKKGTVNLTEAGNNVTFLGIWKLDNRLFDYQELSDGEKTLFAYALLFFLLGQNPNLNIKESILVIDEPELHLHPNSEIDLIEGLRRVIGDRGQLIIATHSINILSTLSYEEIFMVKSGVIKPPSQSTPGESLSELMGIEERIQKLSDFLSSISTWTYVNFMAQCFSEPDVIQSSAPDDPQIASLKIAIQQISLGETSILLDFGAGKGRLYEQIRAD